MFVPSSRENPLNRLTRLPQWVRDVLRLDEPAVPKDLRLDSGIVPVIDMLSVAATVQTGATTAAPGPPVRLPDVAGTEVLVIADIGNTDNVLIGAGPAVMAVPLAPGAALEASFTNLRLLWIQSAGVTPVTVSWIVAQPV